MNWFHRLRTWLSIRLAVKTEITDDNTGWHRISHGSHDRDLAEQQKLYTDILTAWRKNPIAKRTVEITTDYVVGDEIKLSSPTNPLTHSSSYFWNHPQNHMPNRLESMCDELTRAGDLFPVLLRNAVDGMSYIRFLTKDQIGDIQTKKDDWETEMVYKQSTNTIEENDKNWYSPQNGRSRKPAPSASTTPSTAPSVPNSARAT